MKTSLLVLVVIIAFVLHFGFSTTIADAIAFCAGQGQVGRFPAADLKKYYNCYLYGGQIMGQIYTCPGSTIFNETIAMCAV